ncbi:MAG: Crp/Fnr family transcriptional regulator [Bacteroidota bacterium]
MLQLFIDHLQQEVELTSEDQDFILKNTRIKKLKRGEFLLKGGEVSKAFFFNLRGFIRLFYLQEGEEKTAYFYPKNTFISAYASFIRQEPAEFYLQATEKSEVIVIGKEEAQKFLTYDPKFALLARMAMEEELIHYQKMVSSLLTQKAEQRFEQLLMERPEIFQRVPQLQIASYLGIKAESLSRIKKRLSQKP